MVLMVISVSAVSSATVFGEAEQAVLGRHVGALVLAGDQRMDRADVHDAAEAARAHAGQRGTRESRRRSA
jgi:hypothetical protein